MNKSTQGIYPILTKLKNYVLYLKHNLNAKAVGSLSGEMVSIENGCGKTHQGYERIHKRSGKLYQ